ncbi:MAG: hypothetical protein K2Q11_11410 [Burkholderiaceae bacterium]|nr:hypothetical protein [Burkholderiaceae bacterium]
MLNPKEDIADNWDGLPAKSFLSRLPNSVGDSFRRADSASISGVHSSNSPQIILGREVDSSGNAGVEFSDGSLFTGLFQIG